MSISEGSRLTRLRLTLGFSTCTRLSYRACPTFALQERLSLFGGFLDQEAHFRVRRLEIRRKSLPADLFGRHRADRCDDGSSEGRARRLLEPHVGRNSKQVH